MGIRTITIAFDVREAFTAKLVLLALAETVGMRLRETEVRAEDEGIMKYFTLLFYVEDGTWEMVAGE